MGLINIQTNADLERRDAERSALADAERAAMTPQMLSIAAHIRSQYAAARQHKDTYVTPRLLACRRQKAGEYDPATLAKISAAGGCQDFFNISETKTDALEAWISDAVNTGGEIPFALLPTPVPDLPEERKAAIVDETTRAFAEAMQAGFTVSPKDVYEAASNAFDMAQEEQYQQARARAEAMEQKMRDQMVEGGFSEAFDECIRDYAMYPTCILKGPVLTRRKVLKWVDGAAKVVDEVQHLWQRVDPFKAFPSPNVANAQEGSFCEVMQMEISTLQAQKGNPGWNGGQIDAVLAAPASSLSLEQSDSFSDQALMESRDTMINAGAAMSQVWAVEFWGKVTGVMLLEWGLKAKANDEPINPLHYYDVQAVLVGSYVVRCILAPHPLGRRPYHTASFVEVSGSIWGRSMLEKMADAQRGYNNTSRQMMNAQAEASRVRSIIDADALDPKVSKDDYPGKVWIYNGNRMNGGPATRKPVEYWQASLNVGQYLKTLEHFELAADNRTLVPRYIHGDQNVPGAGKTASGLSMLMSASHKGIKRSLGNIDRGMIRSTVKDLYDHNLVYLPDADWSHVKGDARIEARGALHLIQKETAMARRENFLQTTNNPTDMAIIGAEGRAEVLRAVAAELSLSTAEIVPDKSVLQRRAREMLKQQQLQDEAALAGGGEGAQGAGDGGRTQGPPQPEGTQGAQGTQGGVV